ncbi:MAG: cell division protein FtsZ [Chthonomonas sp.]|nr:cell division protein FtsZ [Chthonomonas sp.]
MDQGVNVKPESLFDNQANIKVIGVGGAGGNAVNRMVEVGVAGVTFVSLNTDEQALEASRANIRMQLGTGVTRGLGAGGDPEIGQRAAKESEKEIAELLAGTDMVFITAGMGGGTGTGGAPVVAQIARSLDILTVGVVTKPFLFEGPRRKRQAEEGAARLREHVDTLITVPNDKLVQFVEKKTTMQAAFKAADDVLRQGVQGISDIIYLPGLINVDFADVRSVLKEAGVALMGMGRGIGEQRARLAAQAAVSSPLIETNVEGATKLLVNITAGRDFTIGEAHDAMEYIMQFADPEEAEVYMGQVTRDGQEGEVYITLLAAGMPENARAAARPNAVFTNTVPTDRPGVVAPQPSTPQPTMPQDIALDEVDVDIPAFLRRQKFGMN